ncbi:hypothetical protein [Patulibacter sp.]|uniref:hypothetical protein n=1 Tax=Patulibacter sp. TaxID=1912859 RepID=UPI002717D99C|nr:hypothetical protein [Patulibacter sp.]MDO9408475.1 hypothetical protein [Patulibacter sp.]
MSWVPLLLAAWIAIDALVIGVIARTSFKRARRRLATDSASSGTTSGTPRHKRQLVH